jgi:hypothetical protein
MQDGDRDLRTFRSTPEPLTAAALYDVIAAHVTHMLAEAAAGDDLTIEYHTPSCTVLHVTDVGYTSTDLIILYARDPKQQACPILVHKTVLQHVTETTDRP